MVKNGLNNAEIACDRRKNKAMEVTNGLAPSDRGFKKFEQLFKTVSDKIDEIEAEMTDLKARADFLDVGNAEVSSCRRH